MSNSRLKLLRGCIKRRHWKGARFIVKSTIIGTFWPFCRRCGSFGFKTRPCCDKCSADNIIRDLFDGVLP